MKTHAPASVLLLFSLATLAAGAGNASTPTASGDSPTTAAAAAAKAVQTKGCVYLGEKGKYTCDFLPGCINGTSEPEEYTMCMAGIEGGHFLPAGLKMTHDRLTRNLISFLMGIVLFGSCFFIMHDRPFGLSGAGLMGKMYPEMWASLSVPDKGDMASRLHSSLHAIVCWGHLWGFTSCGIWGDMLANDCAINEFFFGLTAGYFVFDFFLVLYYRMAFWQVFIVHHICAFR